MRKQIVPDIILGIDPATAKPLGIGHYYPRSKTWYSELVEFSFIDKWLEYESFNGRDRTDLRTLFAVIEDYPDIPRFRACLSAARAVERAIKRVFPGRRSKVRRILPQSWRKAMLGKGNLRRADAEVATLQRARLLIPGITNIDEATGLLLAEYGVDLVKRGLPLETKKAKGKRGKR